MTAGKTVGGHRRRYSKDYASRAILATRQSTCLQSARFHASRPNSDKEQRSRGSAKRLSDAVSILHSFNNAIRIGKTLCGGGGDTGAGGFVEIRFDKEPFRRKYTISMKLLCRFGM